MYAEFIKKTSITDNRCCSRICLFTSGHSVEEIRKLKISGRKIVCFGMDIDEWLYIMVLKEAGLGPDVITYNGFKDSGGHLGNIPIYHLNELLKEKDKYYFIIRLQDVEAVNQVRKQLLLWGITDFGILTLENVFDFDCAQQTGFGDAFMKAFNRIHRDIDFTDNFKDVKNNFINPVKWWNDAAEWLLENYSKRRNIKLLDVGPGCGLASLIYKELLDVSVDWINLEKPLQTYMVSLQESIISDYQINVQYGYIETDDFKGTYDIILLTEVLEHFAFNPLNTFKKLYKMLNPDGKIVITTPNSNINPQKLYNYISWRDLPDFEKSDIKNKDIVLKITGHHHVYEYTPEELNDVLVASGFNVIYKNDYLGRMTRICSKN